MADVDAGGRTPTEAAGGAEPVIRLSDLTKYYGDVRGIENVSLDVSAGEIFGFLGPNGAGKSTAIRTLLGFLRPTDGEARLFGRRVTDRAELREAKARVGYVPGDPGFYDGLSGTDHLDYYARLRGDDRRAELEERFPVPFDRDVREYSRGNQQKLALIQAFMHDPDLVVMDEPTAGLDPLVQNTLYEFLETERDRGLTVFFSSHILSEVRRVCDRVAIVRNGTIVARERIEELLHKSGKVVTVEFGDDRPPVETFDLPGVARAAYENGVLRLVVADQYDALLDALADFHVVDIEIRESSLEDVFMHFYEGEADARPPDAERGGRRTPPDARRDGDDEAGAGSEATPESGSWFDV